MPVTRDPRYVETCARVTRNNVKIGTAKNLAGRRRNYWKDFDRENVEYVPIALVENYREAETAILRHLRAYRMRSPKGGLMDWLENIELETAIAEALFALKSNGIHHHVLIRT